ncbi:hypothetical protein [Nocardiopsis tropica]|uniref:Uncharacterized protein n=1 Tax=Nocardiopsis tropica TaxID=109330 RepID=A0ABU7KQT1_9ACTN|nr:hypothetical protein [Nocardiopsis umidischolae]MEE2051660.1 hypothetical protein [Nocardiopsis umidischolae]
MNKYVPHEFGQYEIPSPEMLDLEDRNKYPLCSDIYSTTSSEVDEIHEAVHACIPEMQVDDVVLGKEDLLDRRGTVVGEVWTLNPDRYMPLRRAAIARLLG